MRLKEVIYDAICNSSENCSFWDSMSQQKLTDEIFEAVISWHNSKGENPIAIKNKIKEMLDEAIKDGHFGEVGHWIAAPMKDVGTSEQFHEVVDRAETIIKAMLRESKPDDS